MNPKIKLILIVRDPVKRLVSDFIHCCDKHPENISSYWKNLNTTELWKRFENELVENGKVDVNDTGIQGKICEMKRIVTVGLYYHSLAKWYQHFPPSQVTTYMSIGSIFGWG